MPENVPARPSVIKRFGPWVMGVAILVVIATRIPMEQFKASLHHGPHLQLLLAQLAVTFAVWGTDSVSTWAGLRALGMNWSLRTVAMLRGATNLLFLLNYALGQGGFGYYLYKGGTSAMRAVGSTLFLIGTNLATLILLTGAVWLISGGSDAYPAMRWVLVITSAGFGMYLVIIAARPAFLMRRELFAPLFDAGLGGHGIAIVGRIPHVTMVVLAYWIAMRVWGIEVPFVIGVSVMPAVVLAGVLPISPAGLGTTQATMVYFFSVYASGTTADIRAANVFAFGIVQFVYSVIAGVLVGVICLPAAKRFSAQQAKQT